MARRAISNDKSSYLPPLGGRYEYISKQDFRFEKISVGKAAKSSGHTASTKRNANESLPDDPQPPKHLAKLPNRPQAIHYASPEPAPVSTAIHSRKEMKSPPARNSTKENDGYGRKYPSQTSICKSRRRGQEPHSLVSDNRPRT